MSDGSIVKTDQFIYTFPIATFSATCANFTKFLKLDYDWNQRALTDSKSSFEHNLLFLVSWSGWTFALRTSELSFLVWCAFHIVYSEVQENPTHDIDCEIFKFLLLWSVFLPKFLLSLSFNTLLVCFFFCPFSSALFFLSFFFCAFFFLICLTFFFLVLFFSLELFGLTFWGRERQFVSMLQRHVFPFGCQILFCSEKFITSFFFSFWAGLFFWGVFTQSARKRWNWI